jgi:hypothetical protein
MRGGGILGRQVERCWVGTMGAVCWWVGKCVVQDRMRSLGGEREKSPVRRDSGWARSWRAGWGKWRVGSVGLQVGK